MTLGSPWLDRPDAELRSEAVRLSVLTLACGGGVNWKFAAAGRTNEIDVKPTWNAGPDACLAKS